MDERTERTERRRERKIEGENRREESKRNRGEETLHPQDRLLVVEALAYWASGHGAISRPSETSDRRAHRAAEIAESLLAAEDFDGEFSDAVETGWYGAGGHGEGETPAAPAATEGTPEEGSSWDWIEA